VEGRSRKVDDNRLVDGARCGDERNAIRISGSVR
jgi:hypothetical protein